MGKNPFIEDETLLQMKIQPVDFVPELFRLKQHL